jgi:hypothetical protein
LGRSGVQNAGSVRMPRDTGPAAGAAGSGTRRDVVGRVVSRPRRGPTSVPTRRPPAADTSGNLTNTSARISSQGPSVIAISGGRAMLTRPSPRRTSPWPSRRGV